MVWDLGPRKAMEEMEGGRRQTRTGGRKGEEKGREGGGERRKRTFPTVKVTLIIKFVSFFPSGFCSSKLSPPKKTIQRNIFLWIRKMCGTKDSGRESSTKLKFISLPRVLQVAFFPHPSLHITNKRSAKFKFYSPSFSCSSALHHHYQHHVVAAMTVAAAPAVQCIKNSSSFPPSRQFIRRKKPTRTATRAGENRYNYYYVLAKY